MKNLINLDEIGDSVFGKEICTLFTIFFFKITKISHTYVCNFYMSLLIDVCSFPYYFNVNTKLK